MVLMSLSSKQVALLSLTGSWEDRIEEAQERKRKKYTELVAKCQRNESKARCDPIVVGCRGFAGKSLHRVLGLLGICGMQRRRTIKDIKKASEKTSQWLWLRGEVWHSALPGHRLGDWSLPAGSPE